MRYIFIFLYCLPAVLYGQSLYNNNSLISIEENAIFSIGQDAFNNGVIINNGSFLISGTWINDGTYDPGLGDFTLNSPNEQIVNHNAQSFQRLIIRGGGAKVFLADLSIDDNLELVNGIMRSENGARLRINPGATIIGGSDDSYIAGPLFLPQDSDLNYPIGNNTSYLPILLEEYEGSAEFIGFEILTPNPLNESNSDSVEVILEDYAWSRTDLGGDLQSANVTLTLTGLEILGDIQNVTLLSSENDNIPYGILTTNSLSGDLISGSITSQISMNDRLLALASFNTTGDIPDIAIINAVTPGNDNRHDFLRIDNIEFYPNNEVKIINRWGDLLWEASGYDNETVLFEGRSNISGNDLENGTYYYVIQYGGRRKTGFFVLRR